LKEQVSILLIDLASDKSGHDLVHRVKA
jgi:hypothetical protein